EWQHDPEVARLRAVAEAHGVSDRVRFLGPVAHDRTPQLYRSVDVVVSAPWYEPFGTVPLEAMACGVPPVVTAVGGHLDTVVDGETGLVVPRRTRQRWLPASTSCWPTPSGVVNSASLECAGCAPGTGGTGWRAPPKPCTGRCFPGSP